MRRHDELNDSELSHLIRRKEVTLAGNQSLKIFGTLSCKSGKRMKRSHRVFFKSETEALREGFRPCGHCMRPAYLKWRSK